MRWIRIRSRRDPAFWAPLLVVILAAGVAALGLQHWTAGWTRHLEDLRQADPRAAAEAARDVLHGLAWAICAGSLLVAGLLFRFFQLSVREERLPPSGWWSLGAFRAMAGTGARRAGRVGMVVCVVIAAAGVGFLVHVLHLLSALEGA